MADSSLCGNTRRLGVNTHQTWTFYLEPDNPLGVAAGHYKFGISGYLPVTSDEVIEVEEIGLIFKTTGLLPAPRRQDVGRFTEGPRRGFQPVLCEFPVMHANYHLGVQEGTMAMGRCWEHGLTVMFQDTTGSHRAILAAVIMLGYATNVAATHWLKIIAQRRDVPWIFQEILDEFVANGSQYYCPEDWRDYILFCRLLGRTARMRDHNYLMRLPATPPPLGTPRSGHATLQAHENRFAEQERLSFESVTPIPPRESAERERGILPTEQVDPAPHLAPPDARVVNPGGTPGPSTPPFPPPEYTRTYPPGPGPPPGSPTRCRSASPRHTQRSPRNRGGSPRYSGYTAQGASQSPRGRSARARSPSARHGRNDVRPMWQTGAHSPTLGSQSRGNPFHEGDVVYRVGGSGIPLSLGGSTGTPCTVVAPVLQPLLPNFGVAPVVDNPADSAPPESVLTAMLDFRCATHPPESDQDGCVAAQMQRYLDLLTKPECVVGNPPPTGSGENHPLSPPVTPPPPQASTFTATSIDPSEVADERADEKIAEMLQVAQKLVEAAEMLGQRQDEIAAETVQPQLPAASMADILTTPAMHQTTPSIADSFIWESCASWRKPNHEEAHSFAAGTGSSTCLLYTSTSPRDGLLSRMPSSA